MNTNQINSLMAWRHSATLRRNLGTAAILGLAASGALVSTAWLAASAGTAFVAITTLRLHQLHNDKQDKAG